MNKPLNLIIIIIGTLILLLIGKMKGAKRQEDMPTPTPEEKVLIDLWKQRVTRQLSVLPFIGFLLLITVWTKSNPGLGCSGFGRLFVYSSFGLIVPWILIFSYSNFRCPSCDCYLGWEERQKPTNCHKCGARLR